jgi:hypothetical protein
MWCSRAVNCVCLLRCAAWRTAASPFDAVTLALCPGRGRLTAVPLGRGPFLHSLRQGRAPFVRPLLRYYSLVRLLIRVRIHRLALAFMNRPGPLPGTDEISQVPHKRRLHMHGVSDCARPVPCKPFLKGRCCLLFTLTRSAPRMAVSQLNTQPMVSSVNASRWPSRDTTHHSRPERMARPYPVGDFHLLSFAS